MSNELPVSGLQLQSTVTSQGQLKLELVEVPVAPLKPQEVLLRVEASPINPSDLGLLLGMADLSTAEQGGTADRPSVTASIPEGLVKHLAGRHGDVEGADVEAELQDDVGDAGTGDCSDKRLLPGGGTGSGCIVRYANRSGRCPLLHP